MSRGDRYSTSALAPPPRALSPSPSPSHSTAPRSSHLSLQITHPAAFSTDPDAEYSPLEAPALPFSSSTRRLRTSSAESGPGERSLSPAPPTRPSSASSSSTRHSPRTSTGTGTGSTESLPTTAATANSRRDMHGRGLSDAQEELLVEARNDRENGKDLNPYAWERPLDSVNRHSRMFDTSPLPTTSDPNGRRVSRLPPGVQMLDPFGFSLAAEASPYDLALNASSPATTPGVLSPAGRSPVRASFLQHPQLTTTSTSSSHGGHSHFPSSSSIASNLSATTSTAQTSPAAIPPPPWTKPRAASAGEVQQLASRAQIKSGLLGPPVIQRGASSRSRLSKLSGEIDAETLSGAAPATSSKSQLPAFVPADSDYLNSKLYARTIKAQKALEKERVKAASKGKMSRYDSDAAKSTSSLVVPPRFSTDTTGRPASIMSVASVGKIRSARRSALGWFKSSSEIALSSPPSPDPAPPSPPLPTSRSSTALPIGPGPGPRATAPAGSAYRPPPSPNFANEAALRSANSSSDYLREARESVTAQKTPLLSSRQASGGSSSSSSSTGGGGGGGGGGAGAGEELVLTRPGPLPVHRKSRASPAGSFQHSPTIQEASPPTTPVDETHPTIRDPLPRRPSPPGSSSATLARPPSQSQTSSMVPTPPHVPAPQQPQSSNSHARRTESTSSAPPPRAASSSAPSPAPPRPGSPPLTRNIPPPPPAGVSSGPPPAVAPPENPVPAAHPSTNVRTSSVPFPAPTPAPPRSNYSHGGSGSNPAPSTLPRPPPSPSKPLPTTTSTKHHNPTAAAAAAGVASPPLLVAPDVSLSNGAEAGVKRRKSSLGLLFGGGGGGGTRRSPDAARGPVAPARTESKPVVVGVGGTKDKVKDKVKESFFGRVKRPDPPAPLKESKPKPPTLPRPVASSSSPSTSTTVPRPVTTALRTTTTTTTTGHHHAPRPPPGAQTPTMPQQQYSEGSPAAGPGPPTTTIRAPDSSNSSASTEFSTLSSSSSTLPPTPSSGRSSHSHGPLSKSVNGGSGTSAPKSSSAGGSAFSNFFGRHRTKSLARPAAVVAVGAGTGTGSANHTSSSGGGQKLSRSKNATPTPPLPPHAHGDDRRQQQQMPVLPSSSRANFVERMTPLKKPSRTTGPPTGSSAYPSGVENYYNHPSSSPGGPNSNDLLRTAHRGHPAFA
ncbi:hypothetical protein JCM11491_005820 [Sporobolomyces phaffii]